MCYIRCEKKGNCWDRCGRRIRFYIRVLTKQLEHIIRWWRRQVKRARKNLYIYFFFRSRKVHDDEENTGRMVCIYILFSFPLLLLALVPRVVREVCFAGFERAKVHGRCSPSLQLVWLDFSFLLLWVLCQKFPSFHSRNWAREKREKSRGAGAPWARNRFQGRTCGGIRFVISV